MEERTPQTGASEVRQPDSLAKLSEVYGASSRNPHRTQTSVRCWETAPHATSSRVEGQKAQSAGADVFS